MIFKDDSWQLQPHKRESYRLTLIPTVFDPSAKAPRFEQYLNEIFAKDADRDQKKETVMQFLGYSLTNNCKFESTLFLIGDGSNGKSILLSIVENLLGEHNVSALTPSEFDDRFKKATLRGKLANITPELKKGLVLNDAALKTLASGEPIEAEFKHQDVFKFRNYAKSWIATNNTPHVRDLTHGFYRKVLLLTFNETFRNPDEIGWREGDQLKDITLKEQLIKESSGILNLALDALRSLRKQGYVTDPPSSLEAKARWRVNADTAAQFVDSHHVKTGPGCIVRVSDLWEAYQEWCKENRIQKPLGKIEFGKRMEVLGFPAKKIDHVWKRPGIEIDYAGIKANLSGYLNQGASRLERSSEHLTGNSQ